MLWAVYTRHPELAPVVAGRRDLDLYEACATGATNRVREILANHPQLAESDAADGFTPLGLAIFFGHPEIARLLLEAGAGVNTPARNALGVSPLHSAVAAGDPATVRWLLENGAQVDAEEPGGATPLHTAAVEGSAEIVRLLLDAGADPNKRMKTGKTPRDLAIERGHTAVAEMLALL